MEGDRSLIQTEFAREERRVLRPLGPRDATDAVRIPAWVPLPAADEVQAEGWARTLEEVVERAMARNLLGGMDGR